MHNIQEENMRNKNLRHNPDGFRFKGELVDEKDHNDFESTGRFIQENPYKTPPNNLSTKRKK